MCTAGFCRDLKLLFKNRDKPGRVEEELVADGEILACRTVGADYFSWGMNAHGCAFVTTAVTAPTWQQLIYAGQQEAAAEQYRVEVDGLATPACVISDRLPGVTSVDDWLGALAADGRRWKGYNLLLVDPRRAVVAEVHGHDCQVRELDSREAFANHFRAVDHGPRAEHDYASSFRRQRDAEVALAGWSGAADACRFLRTGPSVDDDAPWRAGVFTTVSSAVMDLGNGCAYYTASPQVPHLRVSKSRNSVAWDIAGEKLGRFEMSRYIDLNLYHQVERTHPFYTEMLDEMLSQIRAGCDPAKRYRVLELGSGTGIFTEELIKLPFLDVTALEYDPKCCQVLRNEMAGTSCRVVHGDAVEYREPQAFDFVVSTFAHDHIHYDRAATFAANIRANLKRGGLYLMGGEVLPPYSTTAERSEALHRYHGYIVNKALRDGHFRVAQIEINALESGLGMIGDFKRHEALFEHEMEGACMALRKKRKIGPAHPDDVGGVFVYTYAA